MSRLYGAEEAAEAAKQFAILENTLLEHRTLTIFGEIDKDCAQRCTERLLAMAFKSDDPITVFIGSPGGHVESGDTIFDMIRYIKPAVRTVGTGWVGSIAVGDATYMTNPLTGAWAEVPDEVSPVGFFDPQRGIEAMMTGVQNPALVSNTQTEYIINGDLDAQALEPIFDTTQPGTVRVEVTLHKETLFIKKAVIEGRLTAGEPEGVVRTITLSRFDEPITISPPDTG